MKKPLFLDRDGVLNEDLSPYVSRAEDLRVFPYVPEALRKLHEAGYEFYVYSNQQGVALGITPEEELAKMDEKIQACLRPLGFEIRKFYYCTALDAANHPWRKPNPGMLLAAKEEFGLDLSGAFAVGDKWSDLTAGQAAGCRPLLLLSGVSSPGEWEGWKVQPEQVFPTLAEAADWILENGN